MSELTMVPGSAIEYASAHNAIRDFFKTHQNHHADPQGPPLIIVFGGTGDGQAKGLSKTVQDMRALMQQLEKVLHGNGAPAPVPAQSPLDQVIKLLETIRDLGKSDPTSHSTGLITPTSDPRDDAITGPMDDKKATQMLLNHFDEVARASGKLRTDVLNRADLRNVLENSTNTKLKDAAAYLLDPKNSGLFDKMDVASGGTSDFLVSRPDLEHTKANLQEADEEALVAAMAADNTALTAEETTATDGGDDVDAAGDSEDADAYADADADADTAEAQQA